MRQLILAVVAVGAAAALVLPTAASARAARFAGGQPVVGCQLATDDNEWLNPAVAPSRCTMLYRHTLDAIRADNRDDLHGVRWSHWGSAVATGTGWLTDSYPASIGARTGPFRVTLKAWRLRTMKGDPPPLANTPICRDDVRYYSRVTVTMPANSTYEASQWTDAALAPTRQC